MHHIDKYQSELPELTKRLKKSFYVDDLVTGASDINEATELFKKSREVMAAGGMNLRKWKSNSPELKKQIEHFIMPLEDQRGLHLLGPNVEDDEAMLEQSLVTVLQQ